MKKFAVAFGGESLIKEYDLYGYRRGVREIVCCRLRRGKPFTSSNWYACPAGRVCGHLRWGESYNRLNQHGSPPWRSFYSCKRNQNTLGALPQDPCRWLCWIRIDLRREPKINPYCAQNRSQGSHRRICPFPPPPFPRRERGSDGLAIRNRE